MSSIFHLDPQPIELHETPAFQIGATHVSLHFRRGDAQDTLDSACHASAGAIIQRIREAAAAALANDPNYARLERIRPQIAAARSEQAALQTRIDALTQQRLDLIAQAPSDLREQIRTIDAELDPAHDRMAVLERELAVLVEVANEAHAAATAAAKSMRLSIMRPLHAELKGERARVLGELSGACEPGLMEMHRLGSQFTVLETPGTLEAVLAGCVPAVG